MSITRFFETSSRTCSNLRTKTLGCLDTSRRAAIWR